MAGREIAQSHRPALVAGDLNDVAWSHTSRLFRRIAQMLDPRVGRGIYSTFHVRYWFLCWPLDHIFIKYGDKGNNNTFLLRRLQRLRPLAPTIFRERGVACAPAGRRGPRRSTRQAAACGSDRGRSTGAGSCLRNVARWALMPECALEGSDVEPRRWRTHTRAPLSAVSPQACSEVRWWSRWDLNPRPRRCKRAASRRKPRARAVWE
jgi:hypothetical protein